jgi:hypothetical protein
MQMIDHIVRVAKGEYTNEDIDFLQRFGIYDYYKSLIISYTRDEAFELLKKVLDTLNKPYNTCKTTGKPIAFIRKIQKIKEKGRIDIHGASKVDSDILKTKYICPHCGREFDFEGDTDAMYFVRGLLTFDDIEKPLKSKYPIEIRGGYRINKRVLYFILNRVADTLYSRYLALLHKEYKLIATNVENFRLIINLHSDETGYIHGIGTLSGDEFEVILGIYHYGGVDYRE